MIQRGFQIFYHLQLVTMHGLSACYFLYKICLKWLSDYLDILIHSSPLIVIRSRWYKSSSARCTSFTVYAIKTLDWRHVQTRKHYTLFNKPFSSSQDHATFGETAQNGIVLVGGSMDSTFIAGLRPFRLYSVTVSATAGGGTGSQSSPGATGQTADGGQQNSGLMTFSNFSVT